MQVLRQTQYTIQLTVCEQPDHQRGKAKQLQTERRESLLIKNEFSDI